MKMSNILRMTVLFIGAGVCAVLGDNMDTICDKVGLKKEMESMNALEANEENVSEETTDSEEGKEE